MRYFKLTLFALMIAVTWLSLNSVNQTDVGLQIHLVNIGLIFASLLVLQVARRWLESKKYEDTGRAPIRSGLFDFLGNLGVFCVDRDLHKFDEQVSKHCSRRLNISGTQACLVVRR